MSIRQIAQVAIVIARWTHTKLRGRCPGLPHVACAERTLCCPRSIVASAGTERLVSAHPDRVSRSLSADRRRAGALANLPSWKAHAQHNGLLTGSTRTLEPSAFHCDPPNRRRAKRTTKIGHRAGS